ncbi:MAG: glycosyltransferase [Bacteroidales bacterium]|jgi:glycosyltransferase involved in cell wall biosynthesis
MKICYLADGESVHTVRWCKYFKESGHEIHLITFKNVLLEGINVHYIDAGKINISGGNWKIILKYRRIKLLINKIKPDILHAHYATSYGLIGALANYHPYIVTALGTDVLISPFQSKIYKLIIKFVMRKADWITSMAEHMTEKLVLLGVEKGKIDAVIFGIDDEIFNKNNRKLPDDKFVIASTRNFEPVYNIPLFFNAIKIIKDKIPNIHVNMLGDGSLRNEFKKMVNKLEISDVVDFIGKVPQPEIAEVLNNSHLFVTLSLSDGNNISLNEAMACGAFPIASDIPANRQWITDGINGFIVPLDNPDILAEKILFVYENYNKLEKDCFELNDKIIQEKLLWRKNMNFVEQKYKLLSKKYEK